MTESPTRPLAWIGWLSLLAVLTVLFIEWRTQLDRLHVALTYLLIVLGGSATGGRALGLSLTALAYLCFHFFFVSHFDSLVMENPLDALVLVTFVATALVAERLLARAREEAAVARAHAAEVERLADERERLRAAAEEAEARRQTAVMREALLTGFSHDLRTPLTTIKAIANRLDRRIAPEAATIEREADRLHRIATDLLDLSRLQAGALPLRPALNTAADLVGAALLRLDVADPTSRVEVTGLDDADGEPLTGVFDFVHALRALGNLLENALKYGPPEAPVHLVAVRDGDDLVLRVSDEGPGIDAAERERIFEPFHRAPGVPTDAGGTGLGLAIARGLAREQGGDVRCLDRAGRGSVFELRLPGARPQAVASAPAMAASDRLASP